MGKSFKVTWLGDTDPTAQIIHMGDIRFIKGEAVSVPADHDLAETIRGNPLFAVDDVKAEPVPAIEPEPQDQPGTEIAALKNELRTRGQDVRGNPNAETLRKRLAELPD